MGLLNKKELKLFLTFFIIYLTFLQFNISTSKTKLDLTLAIVYDHSLQIDNWKDAPPFDTGSFAFYEGHYYSNKAPLESFLAVPIAFIFKLIFGYPDNWFLKWVVIYLVLAINSALFSALTCIVLYRLLGFFTKLEKFKVLITITYGLGTMVFFNAINFAGYTTSNFFILSSFYILLKLKKSHIKNYSYFFISGLLAGLAFLGEYTYIFIGFGLLIYVFFSFKSWKPITFFLCGLSVCILTLFTFHTFLYGNPLDVGYFHMEGNHFHSKRAASQESTLLKYPIMLSDVFYLDVPLDTKFKIFFHNCIQLLFFPFKGLFFYSPIIFFCLLGLFFMYKKYRSETILISSFFLFFLFLMASRTLWWTVGATGFSRFSPIIPFLMIPLVFALKRINKTLIYTVIGLSIIFCFISLQQPFNFSISSNLIVPVIKYNFICEYQIILNHLLDYFLPFFIAFGPRSYLLERIFWHSFFPFWNIFLLSIFLLFLWKENFFNFILKKKNILIGVLLIILILVGLRIVFNSEIMGYVQSSFQDYSMQKENCKPLYPTNFFSSIFLIKDPDPRKLYAKLKIPSILEIDPDINSCCSNNKNWYQQKSFVDNTTEILQNATIGLVNDKDENITVQLDFRVKSKKNKTLVLYLDDEIIGNYNIRSTFEVIRYKISLSTFEVIPSKVIKSSWINQSQTIFLKPGNHILRFHVVEGCESGYEMYKDPKNIKCVGLFFDKLELRVID